MTDKIKLNNKQNEAYSLMSQGKNIFITGMAGGGKTSIIKLYKNVYGNSKQIAVTSTTGVSALLIGGTTLHSYTGIGLGTGSVGSITTTIFKRAYLRKRWNDLDTLIIDEISMLSPDLFDKLEEIARVVRHDERPFGGIQVILSGDFCQLPAINADGKFCFQAESWNKVITHTVYLDKIIRQSDPVFQKCLNNIRIGSMTKDTISMLKSRVGIKLTNAHGIKATKLFSLNYAVDRVNEQELDVLAEDDHGFYEYNMEIEVYSKNIKASVIDKFKKYCTAKQTLQLCIGAQVMLLCNLDLDCKLANGSRGVVVRFVNDIPVVKFLSGSERIIDYHIWEVEENDKKTMRATQIPLKLAWACSIHKIQGATLDYVEIDLSQVFEYGQAYVALSRVKNLSGLSIIDIDVDKIKAHPEAIEYYNNLKKS
jgi:ATP-dependent DNA helicase PIF1